MENKDKYIIVEPEQMNSFYQEGYEFLGIITNTKLQRPSIDNYYGNPPTDIEFSGLFMGNEIKLTGNFKQKSMILMGLSKTSEVLYGNNARSNED